MAGGQSAPRKSSLGPANPKKAQAKGKSRSPRGRGGGSAGGEESRGGGRTSSRTPVAKKKATTNKVASRQTSPQAHESEEEPRLPEASAVPVGFHRSRASTPVVLIDSSDSPDHDKHSMDFLKPLKKNAEAFEKREMKRPAYDQTPGKEEVAQGEGGGDWGSMGGGGAGQAQVERPFFPTWDGQPVPLSEPTPQGYRLPTHGPKTPSRPSAAVTTPTAASSSTTPRAGSEELFGRGGMSLGYFAPKVKRGRELGEEENDKKEEIKKKVSEEGQKEEEEGGEEVAPTPGGWADSSVSPTLEDLMSSIPFPQQLSPNPLSQPRADVITAGQKSSLSSAKLWRIDAGRDEADGDEEMAARGDDTRAKDGGGQGLGGEDGSEGGGGGGVSQTQALSPAQRDPEGGGAVLEVDEEVVTPVGDEDHGSFTGGKQEEEERDRPGEGEGDEQEGEAGDEGADGQVPSDSDSPVPTEAWTETAQNEGGGLGEGGRGGGEEEGDNDIAPRVLPPRKGGGGGGGGDAKGKGKGMVDGETRPPQPGDGGGGGGEGGNDMEPRLLPPRTGGNPFQPKEDVDMTGDMEGGGGGGGPLLQALSDITVQLRDHST